MRDEMSDDSWFNEPRLSRAVAVCFRTSQSGRFDAVSVAVSVMSVPS